jgi:hypothetical protein
MMKFKGHRCISWLVIALISSCFISACSMSSVKLPKMPKLPKLFGAKDKKQVESVDNGSDEGPGVPGNRMTGVVHLVNDQGRFVLVKSITGGWVNAGENTIWMSYGANGKPSAKLKVSAERKGVFVVADIVEGAPSQGDKVVLHGLMDKKGKVTTVKTPGGGEKQILE